ncbi:MAG: hypothetical protein ACR5K7_00240 [Symbiopectobacterium sp.]
MPCMLSTFVVRYSSALLARYFNSDFTVLLPHRSLKEADIIAVQLVKTLDTLPITLLIDRENVLQSRSLLMLAGQNSEQVMDKRGMLRAMRCCRKETQLVRI